MTSGSYRDGEWLYNAYVQERKSAAKIAIECGVSRSTILYWMKKHGIEKRFGDGMKVSDVREAQGCGALIWIIAGIVALVAGLLWLIEEFKEAYKFFK